MEREDVPPDLSKQAIDLWSRYTRDGDLETLHKAVAGFRAAAGTHDPWAASNLSNALLALFKRTGDHAALEEAITVGRSAADAAADPGPEAAALSNLSGALKSSYQLTGNIALLEEASAALRRGISVAPEASMRGVLLANLSDALEKLYARNDDPDVLREAAATLRDGLGLRMSAGPVPAQEFGRLANLLRITYERTGDSEALAEAIAITRRRNHRISPLRPTGRSCTSLRRHWAAWPSSSPAPLEAWPTVPGAARRSCSCWSFPGSPKRRSVFGRRRSKTHDKSGTATKLLGMEPWTQSADGSGSRPWDR